MNRDTKFGQLLAIANVLGERVFEKGKLSISQKYMSRFSKHPVTAFEKIHTDLLEYAPKFGEDEIQLMNLFNEILANMDTSEFTNEPLNPTYLHSYYTQQNDLSNIIGTTEAAEILNLSPDHVKLLCRQGKIESKRIGKTWIINKNSLANFKSSE